MRCPKRFGDRLGESPLDCGMKIEDDSPLMRSESERVLEAFAGYLITLLSGGGFDTERNYLPGSFDFPDDRPVGCFGFAKRLKNRGPAVFF